MNYTTQYSLATHKGKLTSSCSDCSLSVCVCLHVSVSCVCSCRQKEKQTTIHISFKTCSQKPLITIYTQCTCASHVHKYISNKGNSSCKNKGIQSCTDLLNWISCKYKPRNYHSHEHKDTITHTDITSSSMTFILKVFYRVRGPPALTPSPQNLVTIQSTVMDY